MSALHDILIAIRLTNFASSGLRDIASDVDKLKARTLGMREMAKGIAEASLAASGASAAIAAPVYKATEAYNELMGAVAHLSTSLYDDPATKARELAADQAFALEMSKKHVISAKGEIDAIYMATSAGEDNATALRTVADATDAVIATTDNAAEAQAEMEGTTRLITESMKQFGDTSGDVADVLTKLQTAGGFRGIGELHYTFEYLAQAANLAKINIRDAGAMANTLSLYGLRGASGGVAAANLLQQLASSAGTKLQGFAAWDSKGHLDVATSIGRIGDAIKGLPTPDKLYVLKELGITGDQARAVMIFVDHMKDFATTQKMFNNSAGTAANRRGIREGAPDEQMVIQVNKIHDAWIALGAVTSPILLSLMTHIGNVAIALEGWTKAHPQMAHLAAEFAIVAAAVLGVVGVLGLVAAALLAAASLFGAPFVIAAAVIAGVAAFVMMEWDKCGPFFKKLGEDILYYLEHPFHVLPDAIRAGWNNIKDAASWVAHGISRFFVGHSPIPEGPLHDLNLGRHIASTLAPPSTGMLGGVAAAFMGPTFVPAGAFGGMGGGGSIHISFAPRISINGAGGDLKQQIMAALHDAQGELANLVESALMRRRRMNFQ
jgi:TP901 family phage tail tape measure protein